MTQLSEWLKQHQITEVECVTPDFTGIARGKIVPREKFSADEGMRLPEAVLVQTVTGEFADNVTPATDPDMILLPDPNSIRLVPWARAMAHVRREPNSLIYSTARRPDREKQFIWVGPLAPRVTWLWGRAGAEHLPREARDLPLYRFGVVRGEAAVQDLQAHGVPPSSLAQDASNAAVLKMLLSGWVDVVVDTELGMAWNLRLNQQPGTEVQRLFKLSDEGGFYYALNPDSDPARVHSLQAAFDKLRRSGQVDALMRPYLKSAHEAHKPAVTGTTDNTP